MFVKEKMPYITTMIAETTPDKFIATARNAISCGAEAIGFQICRFEKAYRTEENYRRMFDYVGDKPIYVTNYDMGLNSGDSDEELADGLKLALRCGADLIDVPGDLFHKEQYQLTMDEKAVKKQMRLIDEIHSQGKQVLMSTHIFEFRTAEELVKIAKEQIRRGVDVVKIVTASNTEDELVKNIESETILKCSIDKPFLFLSTGAFSKKHRVIGPYFGSSMWLTVYEYGEATNKDQPLLKNLKNIRDHFDTTVHSRNNR